METLNEPQFPRIIPTPDQLAAGSPIGDDSNWENVRQALIVSVDLEQTGIDRLEARLSIAPEAKISLVVVVYPTGITTGSHLAKLKALADEHQPRLEVRVFAKEWDWLPAVNMTLAYRGAGHSPWLQVGVTPNLCLAEVGPSHVNVYFQPEDLLVHQMRRWFDWISGHARPLNQVSVSLPNLVRPEGTEEAARMWREYKARLGNLETDDQVTLDPESGEVTIVDKNGQPLPSTSSKLGLPKLDVLGAKLTKMWGEGEIATITKDSQSKPLDSPLSPRLLGLESERTTGSINVKTAVRVSIFDATTLAELERQRKKVSELLPKFTFAFADQQRWMPSGAKKLFEEEMEAARVAGSSGLSQAVGASVPNFLQKNRERIVADVAKAFRELHGDTPLPPSTLQTVMDAIADRVNNALKGGMMAQVAFYTASPRLSDQDRNGPSWALAFTMILSAAILMREAVIGTFHWRGFNVDPQRYFSAMNVFDDHIVAERNIGRAIEEIGLLKRIKAPVAPARDRCQAVYNLIRGDDKALLEILNRSAESPE